MTLGQRPVERESITFESINMAGHHKAAQVCTQSFVVATSHLHSHAHSEALKDQILSPAC